MPEHITIIVVGGLVGALQAVIIILLKANSKKIDAICAHVSAVQLKVIEVDSMVSKTSLLSAAMNEATILREKSQEALLSQKDRMLEEWREKVDEAIELVRARSHALANEIGKKTDWEYCRQYHKTLEKKLETTGM